MPAVRTRRLLDGEHEKRELLRVLLARLQLAVSDSAERVMGHAQLETTMGYIHRDVAAARSPLETLEAPCA